MRLTTLLPLAGLASAFVIPDEQIMSQVAIEAHDSPRPCHEKLPVQETLIEGVENTFSKIQETSKNAFDNAIDTAVDGSDELVELFGNVAANTKSWIESATIGLKDHSGRPGHHGHHKKPNMTVYQLIAESKYTTKLAALISEYPDLVEALNGTAANYTVFAPTDRAFEKIPEHAPKPSKEQLKKVLEYHVSSDFYPAGRVLVTHTIPTLLEGEDIGFEAQRLSTNIGLKGLTVNFYSRIIAIDIVGLSHLHWEMAADFS